MGKASDRTFRRLIRAGTLPFLTFLLLATAISAQERSEQDRFIVEQPKAADSAEPVIERERRFFRGVLGETEDRWKEIFERAGKRYIEPTLVLHSGQIHTACGRLGVHEGPLYCAAEQKIYLDGGLYRYLRRRNSFCEDDSGACSFGHAYLIVLGVSHHVQQLLGILPKVQQMQKAIASAEAKLMQARLEFQANCLVGVWAHHSNNKWRAITEREIAAGIQTIRALHEHRESTTDGADRKVRWFLAGFQTGTFSACNSFKDRKEVRGVDLFNDLKSYVGEEVTLIDGRVFGADNQGALIKAGSVTFKIITDGLDRETFRFLLTNCASISTDDRCDVRLAVTPAGPVSPGDIPALKNVSLAK